MQIIDRLMKINPEKSVITLAINNLTSDQEIRDFYMEYMELIGSPSAADANIKYFLGYYGGEIEQKWLDTLFRRWRP
jgi:hypothetical protein